MAFMEFCGIYKSTTNGSKVTCNISRLRKSCIPSSGFPNCWAPELAEERRERIHLQQLVLEMAEKLPSQVDDMQSAQS